LTLLEACPQLSVLATSREVLQLDGEHEFVVGPLLLPNEQEASSLPALGQNAAVRMFCERARMSNRDFQLYTANAETVVQICRRLDGLPLAIELAAPYMKFLSAETLLQQFSDPSGFMSLKDLRSGPGWRSRSLPARHQTLQATMAWSYQRLDVAEQRLFRQVSVFAGGFTLAAATTVCGDPDQAEALIQDALRLNYIGPQGEAGNVPGTGRPRRVPSGRAPTVPGTLAGYPERLAPRPEDARISSAIFDGLTALVNKSLVQRAVQPDGETRFSLLETLREYGLHLLAQEEELAQTQRSHAAYYLALAVSADLHQKTAQEEGWHRQLDLERNNLAAMQDWAIGQKEVAIAMRISNALHSYWTRKGGQHEGVGRIARVLALADQAPPSISLAKLLYGGARLAVVCGGHVHSRELFECCLRVSREANDKYELTQALAHLADIAYIQGDYAKSKAYSDEVLGLCQEIGDRWGYAKELGHEGRRLAESGEFQQGMLCCQEALSIHRAIGEEWGTTVALLYSSMICQFQGDLAKAEIYLHESHDLARRLGNGYLTARAQRWLGSALLERKAYEEAGVLFHAALKTQVEYNSRDNVVDVLEMFGGLALARGEAERALLLCSVCAHYREIEGHVLAPVRQARFDRVVQAASALLSDEAQQEGWQRGWQTTIDEAAASILKLLVGGAG
jgi:predicted ATPase